MYTIAWAENADRQMEAIFDSADDETPLHAALSALLAELRSMPLQVGFDRESSVHRMNYERPLLIEYYVIEDDKRVEVLSVFEYHGE